MRGVIMKERIEKIKEWIRKNKKRTIGIAAAAVLLVGALGIGIAGVNGFGSNAAQPDKTAASVKDKETTINQKNNQKKTDKNTKTKNDTDAAEEKVEETKEQDDKDKAADTEKNKESTSSKTEQTSSKSSGSSNASAGSSNTKTASSNTSNSTSSSSSSSSGNGSSGGAAQNINSGSSKPSKPAHEHKWEQQYKDERVWVDTSHNEKVEIAVGNQSGKEIEGDPNEYLLDNPNGDTGWHSEWKDKWVESGYWDTQKVPTDSYKCSCGASK